MLTAASTRGAAIRGKLHGLTRATMAEKSSRRIAAAWMATFYVFANLADAGCKASLAGQAPIDEVAHEGEGLVAQDATGVQAETQPQAIDERADEVRRLPCLLVGQQWL